MPRLKAGVIGVNGIGSTAHLPGYQALAEDVEIFAVCGLDEEKLQEVSKQYDVPYSFTDYHKLLACQELDLVSICLPNFLHAPVVIEALEQGKHVICEKPLALNAEEVRAIQKAAANSPGVVMAGMNNRFTDEALRLKELIKSGALGDVYMIDAGWLRRRGVPHWGDWFLDKEKSGGGPLIDLGVHLLDLAWYLMDRPRPVSVSAHTFSKLRSLTPNGWEKDPWALPEVPSLDGKTYDVEDSAFAFIRLENNKLIKLDVSWALNIGEGNRYCRVYGTKAGANLWPLTIYREEADRLADVNIKTENTSPYFLELKDFVECIKRGQEPSASVEDSLVIMQLIDAIYQSAKVGREIRL